jgi:hypothetical protein
MVVVWRALTEGEGTFAGPKRVGVWFTRPPRILALS